MSFTANSPDSVQMYLGGYAVVGGAAGAGAYTAYAHGTQLLSTRMLSALAIGGASGWALRYANRNFLGKPGVSRGPIPEGPGSMAIAGGIAGIAVLYAMNM